MVGSEQRNKEAEDNEDMIEEANQGYPQCKTTFTQKVRMSCIYGQATGDQTTSLMWEDSLIDKEAKKFLKKKQNGRNLSLDIVAHLEFFYNTLLLS
jgi:hypothetical protein